MLRDNRQDKIRPASTIGAVIPHALFSFKYLTKNNNYSFSFFKKDTKRAHDAYKGLLKKINEISIVNMDALGLLPKEKGFETIPFRQFSNSVQNILSNTGIITNESKLTIFRFCNSYRTICKQDSKAQNIFHIIAFDFDFSAYDHG